MTRAAVVLIAGLLVAGPAASQAVAPAPPGPMSAPDLAAQRAGIMTPSGLDIGFGATVRTYVDGRLMLETQLTWTDKGPLSQRSGDLAAGGASLPGVPGLDGGVTQVLHDVENGRIASVVINTANNRIIRQDTDITLTLPQLPQLQRQIAANATTANLQGAVDAGLRDRPGR